MATDVTEGRELNIERGFEQCELGDTTKDVQVCLGVCVSVSLPLCSLSVCLSVCLSAGFGPNFQEPLGTGLTQLPSQHRDLRDNHKVKANK